MEGLGNKLLILNNNTTTTKRMLEHVKCIHLIKEEEMISVPRASHYPNSNSVCVGSFQRHLEAISVSCAPSDTRTEDRPAEVWKRTNYFYNSQSENIWKLFSWCFCFKNKENESKQGVSIISIVCKWFPKVPQIHPLVLSTLVPSSFPFALFPIAHWGVTTPTRRRPARWTGKYFWLFHSWLGLHTVNNWEMIFLFWYLIIFYLFMFILFESSKAPGCWDGLVSEDAESICCGWAVSIPREIIGYEATI